jgi:hypothetical protein
MLNNKLLIGQCGLGVWVPPSSLKLSESVERLFQTHHFLNIKICTGTWLRMKELVTGESRTTFRAGAQTIHHH